MNSYKEANKRTILVQGLLIIAHTGCMQSKDEEEFFCKHDGSGHSCYCPAGIAIATLKKAGLSSTIQKPDEVSP